MAELLVAGQSNDEILGSLSYKLGPTSEYIQQRRQSRFHPSGASSYSSNTTQIARIELKGQGGYLDMSTLKICFRLAETGGQLPLVLSGGGRKRSSRAFACSARALLWRTARTTAGCTISSPSSWCPATGG